MSWPKGVRRGPRRPKEEVMPDSTPTDDNALPVSQPREARATSPAMSGTMRSTAVMRCASDGPPSPRAGGGSNAGFIVHKKRRNESNFTELAVVEKATPNYRPNRHR